MIERQRRLPAAAAEGFSKVRTVCRRVVDGEQDDDLILAPVIEEIAAGPAPQVKDLLRGGRPRLGHCRLGRRRPDADHLEPLQVVVTARKPHQRNIHARIVSLSKRSDYRKRIRGPPQDPLARKWEFKRGGEEPGAQKPSATRRSRKHGKEASLRRQRRPLMLP